MGPTSTMLLALLTMVVSEIKSDEVVALYPTFAVEDAADGAWSFRAHGKVYESEGDSWRRDLAVRGLAKAMDVEEGTPEAATFDQRMRLFMVDNERGKEVSVRIGARIYPVGESGADGHFEATVRLAADEVAALLAGKPAAGATIAMEVVLPEDDPRRFVGSVQLIGPRGLSIISDIDDTIKVTQVRQRREMMANTMLRPFEEVPGMAALYTKAARSGAAVHYVSGSPWQLYDLLSEFLRRAGFPAGSFHLKMFRLKDSSAANMVGSQEAYKAGHIGPILEAFPQRRFLLVGDSGEQDPEIYGRIARQHPEQVAAIWIRKVSEESADNPRMRAAFEGVPRDRWLLFDEADELESPLAKLLEASAVR